MPRRDRDPRPAIEVFGGAPDLTSSQEVVVGGGPGRGASRAWGLALAAVVAVLVVVGALTGSEGGDQAGSTSSTTVRRSTTTSSSTTTTAPAPVGPVLPVPTGASLLFANEGSRWRVLDLDTGVLRDLLAEGGSTDVYGSLAAVRGGVVVIAGTTASYVPVLAGGAPVELGPAENLIPSGVADAVWLVEVGDDGLPTEMRLVDLRGRIRARRDVPPTYLALATVDGPLAGAGGRTFVIGDDGPRPLGLGSPYGASGRRAVLHSCDERARCGPTLVDTSTGERTEVVALRGDLRDASQSYVLGPDGSILELVYDERGVHLRWVDATGRLLGDADLLLPGGQPGFERGIGLLGEPAWLPGGLGIIVASSDGATMIVRPDGDGGYAVQPIPLPADLRVERVLVISP